jgi:hypothetical protein
MHVHMSEGSVGKQGWNLGFALTSAFVSLFMKKISPDTADTYHFHCPLFPTSFFFVLLALAFNNGRRIPHYLYANCSPLAGSNKILAARKVGIKMITAPAVGNMPERVMTGD